MDNILMTYESFVKRQKKYKTDDYVSVIKIDSDERSENIICDLLVKGLHEVFGNDLNIKRSSPSDYSSTPSYLRSGSDYPTLIDFYYKDFIVEFGLNSTRGKITFSVLDNILSEYVYSFGKKLKKASDSETPKNAIVKVAKALTYLTSEEYLNDPERISKIGIKKYGI